MYTREFASLECFKSLLGFSIRLGGTQAATQLCGYQDDMMGLVKRLPREDSESGHRKLNKGLHLVLFEIINLLTKVLFEERRP